MECSEEHNTHAQYVDELLPPSVCQPRLLAQQGWRYMLVLLTLLLLALVLSIVPLIGFRSGWVYYHDADYRGCGLFLEPIDFWLTAWVAYACNEE